MRAYPQATVVHIIRDPRDVASSLLEKGWLNAGRGGWDDVRAPYGEHARFWVEPERIDEFNAASDARRAGWVWRRYLTGAQAVPASTLEVPWDGRTRSGGLDSRLRSGR